MIIPDHEIRRLCSQGLVDPYEPFSVNPASIDLCLGYTIVDLHSDERKTSELFSLSPGDAILATTLEKVCLPHDIAGMVLLKSSLARQGLDHSLAGWVDPGFCGQLTLELHTHRKITINAGQKILQLVLFRLETPCDNPYNGKYQGQQGPTRAR